MRPVLSAARPLSRSRQRREDRAGVAPVSIAAVGRSFNLNGRGGRAPGASVTVTVAAVPGPGPPASEPLCQWAARVRTRRYITTSRRRQRDLESATAPLLGPDGPARKLPLRDQRSHGHNGRRSPWVTPGKANPDGSVVGKSRPRRPPSELLSAERHTRHCTSLHLTSNCTSLHLTSRFPSASIRRARRKSDPIAIRLAEWRAQLRRGSGACTR